jgi:hypothetical protein
MKAMLLPLTGVEATAAAGDESTPSEKGAGQGFDAVLALVSAQAASQASAPKAPVPAVPAAAPQSEGNAAPALAQPALRTPQVATSAQAGDRAASVGFGPWLAGSAIATELAQPTPAQAAGEQQLVTPALPAQTPADESVEAERLDERADDAQLAPSQDPRGALPAAVLAPQVLVAPQASAAPQTPVEVQAAAGSRASALGCAPAQSQQPAQDEATQAQAAQLFQRELLGAQPTDAVQPAPAQADATKLATARPSARPAAQRAAAVAQAGAARPALAPAVQAQRTRAQPEPALAPLAQPIAPSGAQLAASVQSGVPSQADGARAPAAVVPAAAQKLAGIAAPAAAPAATQDRQGSAAAAGPAAAQELESIVSADPRVTVRMLESAEPEQAPAALPEGEGIAQAALAAAHDERPESEAAGEGQQLEAQAAHGAHRIQAAAFQSAEVQGARGLEAVVASLLRAGNRDASVKQPAARPSAPRAAQLPALETTASAEAAAMRVKLAQGAGNARDALTQERDEREPALREQLELPLPHAFMQPELAPAAKEAPVAQPATPLPVLPQPLDPDAVLAGKPGQTGASITIDHPELGAMDLLVQSQNGRIEVRATLETPHAAQVLRAHESALRYGLQQAGMTFGALRVRTRTGDGETVKARDNVKQRRRDHEWEA